MKVFDDVLKAGVFNRVSDTLLNFKMPWYYISTAYHESVEVSKYGYSFQHVALIDGTDNSGLGEILHSVVLNALDNVGEKSLGIYRIRVGMFTITPEIVIHEPHVDFDEPHNTGVLYINDSDGPTTIYSERYDLASGIPSLDYYNTVLNKEKTILTQVDPKANRLVLFDGLHYHASSTPTLTARRIAINFNYKAV